MDVLRIGILVVDDEKLDAEMFSEQLQETLRKATPAAAVGDSKIEFCVEALHAHDSRETSEQFQSRFLERLVRSEAPGDFAQVLRFVIFDHWYSLPTTDRVPNIDALTLARLSRKVRPDCIRLLLTRLPIDPIAKKEPLLFGGFCRKADLADDIGLKRLAAPILEAVHKMAHAPMWDALQTVSLADKIIMHALATSDGDLLAGSPSLKCCLQFYGPNFFRSESSGTLPPLDSLLHPDGCIRDAQRLYAKGFGAQHCLFVTSGTSASNRIIYQAFCGPGDIVVLDRNCHVSHHYAVAMTRSSVYYVDPIFDEEREIGLSLSLDQFFSGFKRLVAGPDGRIPKLISLTNCTFDGAIIDPRQLIRGVASILREEGKQAALRDIVFLFDEAWFGFARFHPGLSQFSAMAAADELKHGSDELKDVRVYATTSVHKTMYGVRQASVILFNDHTVRSPIFGSPGSSPNGRRLEAAYLAHSTTSPNLGIVASLDVCRRHMWFEGFSAIQVAIEMAAEFVRRCNDPSYKINEVFWAGFASSDAVTKGLIAAKDPSKVTLVSRQGVPGTKLKKILWDVGGIQINKTSKDSCLLMFMPGFPETKLDELVRRLFLVSEDIKREYGSASKVDPDTASNKLRGGGWSENFDLANAIDRAHNSDCESIPLSTDGAGMVGTTDYRSSGFVSPYPPGYPLLVPGQKITPTAVQRLIAIANIGGEIHGVDSAKVILAYRASDIPSEASP